VTRFDDIGMFWQDFPQPKGRNRIAPVMPEIPETGWEMPKYFPNLSAAKVISLDTETYDPELITHGPGGLGAKGIWLAYQLESMIAAGIFLCGTKSKKTTTSNPKMCWRGSVTR
jgi:hypothetical protein